MKVELENLEKEAVEALAGELDLEKLREVEVEFLGRKGKLTGILRGLKDLSDVEKPKMGQISNEVKKRLEAKFEEKRREIETKAIEKELTSEFFDVTVPGKVRGVGHVHPLSQVQEEVERIFGQMGFTIMDGPELESEYYNFEGLNIPSHHPARDMQDTFFVKGEADEKHGGRVMRTHTSPGQVRGLEKYGAPLRIIVPGRVFRYEATDASHDMTFYQVEGMLIDEKVSLADLKGVMAEFLTRLFGHEVKVRFRPGYFPFVEPGVELDFSCTICDGKGCKTCKNSGWIEFMGAGMTHENVLRMSGIDPDKYQGWAFGFGLTRLVMMRYGISDIRYLTNGDLRFIKQF